jgi:hypothetical protein
MVKNNALHVELTFENALRLMREGVWFDVVEEASEMPYQSPWSCGFEWLLSHESLRNTLRIPTQEKAWSAIRDLATYDSVSTITLENALTSTMDALRAVAWDKMSLNGNPGVADEFFLKAFEDVRPCVRGAALTAFTHMSWKPLPKQALERGLQDENERIRGVCLEAWTAQKPWVSVSEIKNQARDMNAKQLNYFLFGLARNEKVVQDEESLRWIWEKSGGNARSEIRIYALMNDHTVFTPMFLEKSFCFNHLLEKKGNVYLDFWVRHPNFDPTSNQIEQLVKFNQRESYPRAEWEHIFLKKQFGSSSVQAPTPLAL